MFPLYDGSQSSPTCTASEKFLNIQNIQCLVLITLINAALHVTAQKKQGHLLYMKEKVYST
ncbi:hypothetical protein NQ317_010183 [Molorchus minor]|uniref:Uncharacterized protein n=1 Tax=Molorchus minor TaxID=1323400 RepID=A0ABQ9JVU1_9CUCU|nr:hypothetical protein NQ317_010183 [Molorchus minor]